MRDKRYNQKYHYIKASILSLASLLVLMWLLELVDWLPGIIIAPFIHGSWAHLIANTLPWLTFGGLVSLQGLGIFWLVTIISTLVSGSGVWLFSPEYVVTVGASGVIL